ncbi:MAG TPA: biotin--[acetyl-CoA-carboxylase] ligase, partial [bacterium]|nr:biotin--[acetyl-CoA-carboxylase] ligase [bacterium]
MSEALYKQISFTLFKTLGQRGIISFKNMTTFFSYSGFFSFTLTMFLLKSHRTEIFFGVGNMKEYNVPDNRFVNFYHFDEIDSTMDESERLVNKGVKRGIVIADCQTGGYGRNNKNWFSPGNGNIYISFFERIDPSFPLDLIPQRVALAVYETVKSFVEDDSARVKWPNDILLDMKKVSGVIARSMQLKKERFYICGIGINTVVPDCEGFSPQWKAGGLIEKNPLVTTGDLVSKLVKEVDRVFQMDEADVSSEYVPLISWMIGKSISFTQDNRLFLDGKVDGFNEDGSMIRI